NCDALTPLPDDLYQYPHLKALVAYPYARTIQYSGKLWGIPRSLYAEEKRTFGSCVIMHADLYDSLGLASPPAELADFADMLRRVRAQSPDILPMTSYTPEAMFDLVYYEAPYRDTWIWNGTRYEPGFLTQAYCDSIARLSPLWQEGLLDPDFMVSAGNPTGMDKFILRQAAAMVYTSSPYEWLGELAVRWQRLYPDTPLSEGVRLLFLPGDANGAYHAPKVANSSMLYLSANMDESKLRRVLSLLDYLYSAEGKRLRRYGLEGEDYVLNEKGEAERLPDASGDPVSLYEKYPSYALIRTLPDLDLGFTGRDKTMDEQVSLLLSQYWDWYDGLDMQEIYTTSLICNTTSTPSGEGFNPRITHNAFRMLCAREGVEAMFEQIKEEYRQQGLERIISEVNWSAKIP
ncbi:MAG TPA: hypothetical protein PKE04_17530, partial [Clostridia bacterium]|nr:hypothetical protein [Clostridia bacterium]